MIDRTRRSAIWLAKRILQKLGVSNLRRSIPPFAESEFQRESEESLSEPELSVLSKRLLAGLVPTLDDIARRRQQQLALWDDLIVGKDAPVTQGITTDHRPSRREWTPYFASYRLDPAIAEKVYDDWISRGLPVMTWPDVPPEVKHASERHFAAWALRHQRLYLPVHQTLALSKKLPPTRRT